jgi:methylamine---glutamate N-methyltransferase subunit A
MCGIAGRILRQPGNIGADLVAIMQAMRHRGWDSTGFALYGPARTDSYVVRALIDERKALGATLDTLLAVTREHGADFLGDPTWDNTEQTHVTARFEVTDPTDFRKWIDACDAIPLVELQSVGRALEIIKDVGDSLEVAERHNLMDFQGTHGLGHVRLATESLVSPVAGHPFWARPFPDVAIVHNGQLTNYYTWRRRLERAGYRFTTENDSELIAVWNSVQMAAGQSLEESLGQSRTDLDGVFTYLLATLTNLGMAKDRFAIKALASVNEPDGVAIATEEQALRVLYPHEVEVINFDEPSLVRTWEALDDAPLELLPA